MFWLLILEDVVCNADIAPSPPSQKPVRAYLAWGHEFSLPQTEDAFYLLTNDKIGIRQQVIKAI